MTGAWSLVVALAGLVAWAGTGWLIKALAARAILDHPNDRSSHERPTPRGAGLAVVGGLALAALAASLLGLEGMGPPALWAAAGVLALVSWRDDRRGLGAGVRLAAQALAVAMVIVAGGLALPSGLAHVAGLGLAALAWLWFVNLFNFMDGIDGITGVETVSIGLGVVLVALAAGGALDRPPAILLAAALAAAAIGFLPWNWAPARIFLGDVGSVPLGFLIGWLLLDLAAAGAWAAALLLPAYYLADASVTLARRAWRREPLWQAHREHFYQQATDRLGHGAVAARIAALNVLLIGCALLTLQGGIGLVAGLGLGFVSTVVLLCYFRARDPEARPRAPGDRASR